MTSVMTTALDSSHVLDEPTLVAARVRRDPQLVLCSSERGLEDERCPPFRGGYSGPGSQA